MHHMYGALPVSCCILLDPLCTIAQEERNAYCVEASWSTVRFHMTLNISWHKALIKQQPAGLHKRSGTSA